MVEIERLLVAGLVWAGDPLVIAMQTQVVKVVEIVRKVSQLV
jgi:hypothetical protein